MESSKLQPYPDFEFFDRSQLASCLSVRLSESLHIDFSWLPVPIRHLCSFGGDYVHQNLAVNFGFFELRTFPGLQSKVQVGSFCPFTAKVDSKSTKINQIILTSSPP